MSDDEPKGQQIKLATDHTAAEVAAETDAMRQMAEALRGLDRAQVKRVLAWAESIFIPDWRLIR